MQIIGIANSYASAPVDAPTSLSGTPSTTSVSIAFTAPTNDGGTAITNYEYSFNNSSWTALSPADAATPVTVSGLSANTAYTIYLRAVNIVGSGPGSTGLSVSTLPIFMSASGGTTNDYASGGFTYRSHAFTSNGTFTVSTVGSFGTVDALVVAGGGGGGLDRGGGGGAGGFRTSTQTLAATSYSVTVGGAGAGGAGPTSGGNSVFAGPTSISSTGGGRGSVCCYIGAASGGSGGGANPGSGPGAGNAGGYSPVEGYRGGNSNDGWMGAGGGGATGVGGDNSYGAGGAGASNSYRTGSNITYSNGGNGMPTTGNSGNYGAGGGGNTNGVQGTVVIRYRIA
jgi:hypothetical protein